MKNNSSCFFMCQPPLPYVLRTAPLPSGNTGYCCCCHTPVFTPPMPHLRHCRPLSNRESGKVTCLIPKRIKKNVLTRTSCCPGRHINYGPGLHLWSKYFFLSPFVQAFGSLHALNVEGIQVLSSNSGLEIQCV